MSNAYLRALYKGRLLEEEAEMQVWQIRGCELLGREGRREFMRVVIEIVRYLEQSREFAIIDA